MAAEELIIVFAKPPTPGAVMTRLLTILTPEQAAGFHLAGIPWSTAEVLEELAALRSIRKALDRA